MGFGCGLGRAFQIDLDSIINRSSIYRPKLHLVKNNLGLVLVCDVHKVGGGSLLNSQTVGKFVTFSRGRIRSLHRAQDATCRGSRRCETIHRPINLDTPLL